MKFSCILFFCVSIGIGYAQKISSPNNNIVLQFALQENGVPTYQVAYKEKPIIKPSKLGVEIATSYPYINYKHWNTYFKIDSISTSSFDETWQPILGEVKNIRNHYNEMAVYLTNDSAGIYIVWRARVFDDGVGFRYEFPQQKALNHFVVAEENTEFALANNFKTWWIPGDYETQEYRYTTSPISQIPVLFATSYEGNASQKLLHNSVQTPLMMYDSLQKVYVNIHEAALIDYPAINLEVDAKNYILKTHLTPAAKPLYKAFVQAPFRTPWRTIILSDKATDILASKLILNLNEPCKIPNTDFIQPMKYVGVWWQMFCPNGGTWAYSDTPFIRLGISDYTNIKPNGRHAANTQHVKKYIDFASKHGFDGVLVEGWNIGWEDIGLSKELIYDFVTPYPDFDVKELQRYATEKKIKMIMHHETSGAVTQYERQMDTAYKFMKAYGYPAVKSGYVGDLIPRGEHHYSQWMVQHYLRAIKKAADYQIMVNAHEPVHLTGMHRTYPNYIAAEAARGTEFESFSGNNPDHTTILPFTRLMGGPMDYTPGIFQTQFDYYKKGDKRFVSSTLAKQLALYVTMYSPLQMAADQIENYQRFLDAFQFIKDVAIDWDDTKILLAQPGDYICIARKAKGKDDWFVGAITDENTREMTLNFDFLDANTSYLLTLYADAKNADYITNPQSYEIKQSVITHKSKITQKLARSGGFAMRIEKLNKQDPRLKKK